MRIDGNEEAAVKQPPRQQEAVADKHHLRRLPFL